jgi:hypothetical protein
MAASIDDMLRLRTSPDSQPSASSQQDCDHLLAPSLWTTEDWVQYLLAGDLPSASGGGAAGQPGEDGDTAEASPLSASALSTFSEGWKVDMWEESFEMCRSGTPKERLQQQHRQAAAQLGINQQCPVAGVGMPLGSSNRAAVLAWAREASRLAIAGHCESPGWCAGGGVTDADASGSGECVCGSCPAPSAVHWMVS